MSNKSYIGKGIVYIEDDNGRLVDVGNVTAFAYAATEEKKELKNFRTAGGGNYNSLIRVTAVNINLTMSDFSANNLSLGLFGAVSAVAAGTVTDEAQTTPDDVSVDFLLPTDNMIDTSASVTVTGYVEGTDFEVKPAGILVLAAGSIPASTALAITYTKKAVDVVQAFVNAARNRRVLLDGLNEADSGKPALINIHKGKFGAAAETAFVGDDFGEIALTGEALQDETITTSGLSQYLEVKLA